MAELIDKKEAIEQIKSIPYATRQEVFFMSAAVSRIRKIPTTTEAEIRAKAISELLGKTEKNTADFVGINGYLTGADFSRILHETAEQLKEG